MSEMTVDTKRKGRKSNFLQRTIGKWIEKYFKYLMITPMTIILLAIAIYPFIFAIRLSLTNAETLNFRNPEWVGLTNYLHVFTSIQFWKSTLITIIYVIVVLGAEIVLGVALAVLVDRLFRGQKLFVSLLITPMLIAPVLAGIIFRLELNPNFGIISWLYKSIGFKAELLSKSRALITMMVIDIWQWTSFIFLIAFAGLKSLPAEPFEATKVYGANPIQTFRMVTLPLIKPVLMIAIIFRLMDAFKAYDHIQILTRGGPDFSTTTLSVLGYNFSYTQDNFGAASALAIIMLIIVVVIVKYLLKIAKWK